MKQVQDATIEEIISDIINYEDHDSFLTVAPNRHGAIELISSEGTFRVQALTFRDALIKFQLKQLYCSDPDLDSDVEFSDQASYKLDWDTARTHYQFLMK